MAGHDKMIRKTRKKKLQQELHIVRQPLTKADAKSYAHFYRDNGYKVFVRQYEQGKPNKYAVIVLKKEEKKEKPKYFGHYAVKIKAEKIYRIVAPVDKSMAIEYAKHYRKEGRKVVIKQFSENRPNEYRVIVMKKKREK